MANLNKVLLIGRIGQEPEKRVTQSGHCVVNISLATSEYYKDQSGNKQEKTEWHRVIFWNKLAEIIIQYCSKGKQIYVEGKIQTKEWNDKNGNRRLTTEIVAQSMQMLDSLEKRNDNQEKQYPEKRNYNQEEQCQGNIGYIEDDIPF